MYKNLRFILAFAGKQLMRLLYAPLKLLPVKRRVCFFSRQSNTVTEDLSRIQQELQLYDPEVEIVSVCCRYRSERDGVFRFAKAVLKSMYYLATSRVCVIDAYWPAVSMLKHKKSLKVIQIWHSMGKIKKSGYQTLGKPSGRDPALAKLMCMHRNYDYIIGGGSAWNRYYCEAFDVPKEKILNYGLPRLDKILEEPDAGAGLLERHPELRGKTVVLYAPTFREYEIKPPMQLLQLLDPAEYQVILRFHPRQKFRDKPDLLGRGYEKESVFDLLKICDWVITDYSSLTVEAAALNKKTLYYLYDHSTYCASNGVNIDPLDIMPGCCCRSETELLEAITSRPYPQEELDWFRDKFLPSELGGSTRNIVLLIGRCIDGEEVRDYGRREYGPLEPGQEESKAFAENRG